MLFDVAGESFRPGYPDNLLQLAEVLRTMDGKEWMAAVLRRDANNEHDRYAIEVHVPGGSGFCGFVPGQLARILAPILDSGTVISAHAVEVRIHHESPNKPGLTIALTLAAPSP
ncbi:MAG: HIRAN domain-containing protein [Actinomycetota bacterium]